MSKRERFCYECGKHGFTVAYSKWAHRCLCKRCLRKLHRREAWRGFWGLFNGNTHLTVTAWLWVFSVSVVTMIRGQ